MKKIYLGILSGAVAGVLDVIPMLLQNITWDANLSAFTMWVVSGFLIATTELKIKPILKGVIIPFLVFIPCALIIGWKQPLMLIPISVITIILGSLLGFTINKFGK